MTEGGSTEAAGASAGGKSAPLHALAVFHDEGAGFWPWLVGRPGFRHCFVALNDGRAWIVIDPCGDGIRIDAEVAAWVDLAAHYEAMGDVVVETAVNPAGRRFVLPWAFTCVEAVKRILGVHNWWVWTPFQLYQSLEQNHGKYLQSAEAESPAATATAAQTR